MEDQTFVQVQREQAELQASIERMRTERYELDAQNQALQALIEREERLAAHLKEVILESRAERQAIEAEKARILSTLGR